MITKTDLIWSLKPLAEVVWDTLDHISFVVWCFGESSKQKKKKENSLEINADVRGWSAS